MDLCTYRFGGNKDRKVKTTALPADCVLLPNHMVPTLVLEVLSPFPPSAPGCRFLNEDTSGRKKFFPRSQVPSAEEFSQEESLAIYVPKSAGSPG